MPSRPGGTGELGSPIDAGGLVGKSNSAVLLRVQVMPSAEVATPKRRCRSSVPGRP